MFPVLRTLVGLNLYMGNNEKMKGTSIQVTVGYEWNKLISAGNSDFYVKETFQLIKKDVFSWIKFLGQKFFTIVTGRDFLTSQDVYFFNSYISKLPIKFVMTRLLFLSAIMGFIITLKHWRRFVLLYLFILSFSFMLFFGVRSRYFMPIIPVLAVFSAYTFYSLYQEIRYKRLSYSVRIVVFLAILYALSQFNPLKIALPNESETYYLIGVNYYVLKNYNKAIYYYSKAVELSPQNITALNYLAATFRYLGDCKRAEKYLERALQIDKDNEIVKQNYLKCQC